MEDQWISVPKRNCKPGRKYGLTGRQQVTNQRKPMPVIDIPAEVPHEPIESTNSFDCNLTEREIEDKFNVISLSIRTEAFTLKNRLEHQQRQRDLAENNLNKEIDTLHSRFLEMRQEVARGVLHNFARFSDGNQLHELFTQVENQVEAVRNSALSISRVAETLGAVEYESRLSAAVELVILYVDTVKRKWEKEHRELEETKRILKESGVNIAECLETFRERSKPSANPTGAAAHTNKRRASFPVSPLRRISTDNSTPTSTAPLQKGQAGSIFKIVEEKDEEIRGSSASAAASTVCHSPGGTSAASASDENQVKSIHSCQPVDASKAALSQPITAVSKALDKTNVVPPRRERRGATKSKSWTSSAADPTATPGKNRNHTKSAILIWLLWLMKAFHDRNGWCRLLINRCQRRISNWCRYIRVLWQHKWEIGQLLLLLRYAAAFCCLIAALASLFITFVPSMAYSVSTIRFPPVNTETLSKESSP